MVRPPPLLPFFPIHLPSPISLPFLSQNNPSPPNLPPLSISRRPTSASPTPPAPAPSSATTSPSSPTASATATSPAPQRSNWSMSVDFFFPSLFQTISLHAYIPTHLPAFAPLKEMNELNKTNKENITNQFTVSLQTTLAELGDVSATVIHSKDL